MLHNLPFDAAKEMPRTLAARSLTNLQHRSGVEDKSALRPTSPESRHD